MVGSMVVVIGRVWKSDWEGEGEFEVLGGFRE